MANRLIREARVAKFTMHDLRRSLRTAMSRCGYDNEIQRLCVGQKLGGIDQVYNHEEQWIICKMAFEAAHDYVAKLVGARALSGLITPGQILADGIDTVEWPAVDIAPFQRAIRGAPPLLQRSRRAPDDRGL